MKHTLLAQFTLVAITTLSLTCNLKAAPASISEEVRVSTNANAKATHTYLLQYLEEMSRKLDFYYTIEIDERNERAKPFTFLSFNGEDIPTPSTIEDLVFKLSTQFPNVQISQNKAVPSIVHLVDKSLLTLKEYPLDEKMDLRFSGNVRGLVNTLRGISNKRLTYPTHFWLGSGPTINIFGDTKTTVDVDTKNMTARSIVSDFIPLSQYSRMLWKAKTKVVNEKNETWLEHTGPTNIDNVKFHSPISEKPNEKVTVPFTFGESAYWLNDITKSNIEQAITYIEQLNQKKDVIQVRWALLFLGKSKAQEAIPVLLDHIDYQYSTSPITAESYPAVKSLIDIGKASETAAVERLLTERDTKRQKLLINVIFSVDGAVEGKRIIENILLKITDANQRQSLLSNLRSADTIQ